MLPIQFITHTHEGIDYEASARLALRGGCRWIQLRVKTGSDDDVEPLARRVKQACTEHGAVLIVDDRVHLAQRISADGVHLGREDMPIDEARATLGEGFVIGGTANTLDDLLRLAALGADYAGLGPFRFTTTKERLAPTLGIEGYTHLMRELRARGCSMPVCAIGGIELADVAPLLAAGVNGIAVSGAILRAADPAEEMRRWIGGEVSGGGAPSRCTY